MDEKSFFLNEHGNAANSARAVGELANLFDERKAKEAEARSERVVLANKIAEETLKTNELLKTENNTLKKQLQESKKGGRWQVVFGVASMILSIVAIIVAIMK